jgi:hypothetical protein
MAAGEATQIGNSHIVRSTMTRGAVFSAVVSGCRSSFDMTRSSERGELRASPQSCSSAGRGLRNIAVGVQVRFFLGGRRHEGWADSRLENEIDRAISWGYRTLTPYKGAVAARAN